MVMQPTAETPNFLLSTHDDFIGTGHIEIAEEEGISVLFVHRHHHRRTTMALTFLS